MALTTTTLASAYAITDAGLVVTSATGFAAGNVVQIDQEMFLVNKNYVSGTTIPVIGGQGGTAHVAHVAKANVTTGLASDFSNPVAQAIVAKSVLRPVTEVTVSATGSLTLPVDGSDIRVIVAGTSVVTLTIPVPTKDMDNSRLTISSNGVAQHLITFTGGLSGAGANYDVITVNATAPASFDFIAVNGLWQAVAGPAIGGTTTNISGTIA